MDYASREEEKTRIDGFEIPIECLCVTTSRRAAPFMLHYHEYVEMLYGIDCDAEVWCSGRKFRLQSGDLVVINSREPHDVCSRCESSRYLVVKFMPQILYAAEQSVFELKYLFPFLSNETDYSCVISAAELQSTELPSQFDAMWREWESREYGYEIALRAHVTTVALWLIRRWQSETGVSAVSETDDAVRAVQRGIEYARNHYKTATAKEAADYCCLSYSYFSRLFRRVLGMTFTEYVRNLRIAEAQRLLVTTTKDATEIAMETGFSTTSYFIVCFRQRMNTTPGRFREKMRAIGSNRNEKKQDKGEVS